MRQRARDGAVISKPTDGGLQRGKRGGNPMSRELYLQWSSASALGDKKEEIARRARMPGLAHDAVKDSRGGRKAFLEDPTIPTAVQQPRPKVTTHRARATQKLESGRMSPPCPLPKYRLSLRLPTVWAQPYVSLVADRASTIKAYCIPL